MALPAIGEDIPRWVHVRVVFMPGGTTYFPWGWHLMNAMTRRWLARASFALVLAAAALLLAVAGWRSLALVAFAVIGVCAVLAGGYWFLANRGVRRWLALALVVAAPVLILVAFALHSLLWVAVGGCGRDRQGRAERRRPGRGHARRPGGAPAAAVPDHEPEVGRGEGDQVRAEGQGGGAGR
jgi:hypothetical protein